MSEIGFKAWGLSGWLKISTGTVAVLGSTVVATYVAGGLMYPGSPPNIAVSPHEMKISSPAAQPSNDDKSRGLLASSATASTAPLDSKFDPTKIILGQFMAPWSEIEAWRAVEVFYYPMKVYGGDSRPPAKKVAGIKVPPKFAKKMVDGEWNGFKVYKEEDLAQGDGLNAYGERGFTWNICVLPFSAPEVCWLPWQQRREIVVKAPR